MPLRRSLIYWLLFLGSVLWLVLIVIPPLARVQESVLAAFGYFAFSPICHQIPERSLFLAGFPLAVCARCTGLYIGFLAGLALFPYLPDLARQLVSKPRLILLFFLPMGFDLLLPNTEVSRILTGFVASFPIALFVWIGAEQLKPISAARRYK